MPKFSLIDSFWDINIMIATFIRIPNGTFGRLRHFNVGEIVFKLTKLFEKYVNKNNTLTFILGRYEEINILQLSLILVLSKIETKIFSFFCYEDMQPFFITNK